MSWYKHCLSVPVEEAENVIVFGSSRKTDQEEPIGMYGNGLKSGSMRLGKDMVLFTKKDGVLTCLMISRTFFQAENVTQVTETSYDSNGSRELSSLIPAFLFAFRSKYPYRHLMQKPRKCSAEMCGR